MTMEPKTTRPSQTLSTMSEKKVNQGNDRGCQHHSFHSWHEAKYPNPSLPLQLWRSKDTPFKQSGCSNQTWKWCNVCSSWWKTWCTMHGSLLANLNLFKNATAEEVKALSIPDNDATVTCKAMSFFLPVPWLRNAVLAVDSFSPFDCQESKRPDYQAEDLIGSHGWFISWAWKNQSSKAATKALWHWVQKISNSNAMPRQSFLQ